MTEEVKILSCDRCGVSVKLRREEPDGFYESPPKGWSIVANNCKTRDLCPVCFGLHERFMAGETHFDLL